MGIFTQAVVGLQEDLLIDWVENRSHTKKIGRRYPAGIAREAQNQSPARRPQHALMLPAARKSNLTYKAYGRRKSSMA